MKKSIDLGILLIEGKFVINFETFTFTYFKIWHESAKICEIILEFIYCHIELVINDNHTDVTNVTT